MDVFRIERAHSLQSRSSNSPGAAALGNACISAQEQILFRFLL